MMKDDPLNSGTVNELAPVMSQLLDLMPHAVYVFDADVRMIYANDAASVLYGWPHSELYGKDIGNLKLFSENFRTMILLRLQQDGQWVGDAERMTYDGSVRTVRARCNRLPRQKGKAVFLAVEEDISEQIVREEELQQARKLAKIGILSEGIVHELRNPLSYAISAAQLLGDSRLDEDVRLQCVQTISTGLRKAGLIVDNLLSLGKPQSSFARSRVDLAAALKDACEAASAHGNYPRVKIESTLPKAGLMVEGNFDMLVQVLHNVISNALNELPDGGRIDVAGFEEGEQVSLHITDSGPGVSEEQIRHLFDPFYTASTSGRGTGLGLTLSYYIMKEHGGSIEVQSEHGRGATFVLLFPHPGKD